MNLNELNIGDKVEIYIKSGFLLNNQPQWSWYKAEVVDKFYDEFGDYVKVLVFPTTIFGEEKMIVRNGDHIRKRLMNFT